MDIERTYAGYCPLIEGKTEIEITYTEIAITRSSKRHFKHNGFLCDIIFNEDIECPYANQNKCPIYEKAPITVEM